MPVTPGDKAAARPQAILDRLGSFHLPHKRKAIRDHVGHSTDDQQSKVTVHGVLQSLGVETAVEGRIVGYFLGVEPIGRAFVALGHVVAMIVQVRSVIPGGWPSYAAWHGSGEPPGSGALYARPTPYVPMMMTPPWGTETPVRTPPVLVDRTGPV